MSGWEEIDARHGNGHMRTYYAVLVGEDYSISPDALFSSEEAANEWVEWQRSLWTEEREKGIPAYAEVFVMPVRDLQGKAWNSYDPLPEDGP